MGSIDEDGGGRARLGHRGRQLPWLDIVRFHKEVVARAEQGFFSLNGRDDQADRWSSITGFDPLDLAGSWSIPAEAISSRPFRLAEEQGQFDSMFLGGPCFLGWTMALNGKWLPQWRPLLYREVAWTEVGGTLEIVPQEGNWSLTPLIHGVMDRMEVSLDDSLDELAAAVIEMAAGYGRLSDEGLDQRVFRALYSKLPGAEAEFGKEVYRDTFSIQPTPWVLFAPTSSFSALTRHLMADYVRLESLLVEDEANIGGLRLLEDQRAPERVEESEVLPLVPLNASQSRAVKRMLERHPLTVISGPPGTGKSQAVVALLLNAWAQGQTVLFASNNNKAVDVVRERVERFESEFPIAVRAGAKQKQNIDEVLRRTLNMAGAAADGSKGRADPAGLRRARDELLGVRAALLEALETKLPQRVDELRKTALSAYGEYRSTLADLDDKEQGLIAELEGLGFEGQSAADVEAALKETLEWLGRVDRFRGLVDADRQLRVELQTKIDDCDRRRVRAVEEIGLHESEVGDWRWLLSGPGAQSIVDWEQRFRTLMETSPEEALEPIVWDEGYSRWHSAAEAEDWARRAREFSSTITSSCAELAPKLESIRRLRRALEEHRVEIGRRGLHEEIDMPVDALGEWTAGYAELVTLEPGRFDRLPWSRPRILRKRLRQLEEQLRPALPLQVLTEIGIFDDKGRERLAPVVHAFRRWLEVRREWDKGSDLVDETETRFRELRAQAGALGVHSIPAELATDLWNLVAVQCDDKATVADGAAASWRRRAEKESTESMLRVIAKEWGRLAAGVPVREAWRRAEGLGFDEAMRALADRPDLDTLAAGRAALYTGRLSHLVECWQDAIDHKKESDKQGQALRAVPEPSDRVRACWDEQPARSLVLVGDRYDDWPDPKETRPAIDRASDWLVRWSRFAEGERPDCLKRAAGERDWAVSKLEQAIEVLPAGPDKSSVVSILVGIQVHPDQDWPLADLNQAFSAFNPEHIRARIEGIEAELERGSFDDAKASWLERLRIDDEAICAVDALEKSIRQHKGKVVESEYGTFRTALRAVPIWITTAQASQAIPLEPELFDVVVIDEASQCTLTNLLPLMYRGRTLAVIGDDNQLPAIPTIQESEELALARRFEIEQYLPLVGHATNDVYKAATESLPRRRADVIMLDEHFRSHPQIIGFSNRHIYLQRLELKKDPSWGQRLPIGSGVHSVDVTGLVRRGDRGRSWVNEPEAEAVIELVQQLKQGDSRSLSLGVVTPFAAQKEYLRERLDSLRLTAEVLVDTAYGFQGDERDVIVFSPVVAKGITSSAGRWVESPPNLINVAITRAREALFVVADFDHCLQQAGLLRKLVLYCREVQLLRDTSQAELDLFSWMMVKGWEPKVHPQIGDIEVDFVLESAVGKRLAIEVDGGQHRNTEQQDKARDAYLLGRTYGVLRFPAREVLETPFEVIHRIELELGGPVDAVME